MVGAPRRSRRSSGCGRSSRPRDRPGRQGACLYGAEPRRSASWSSEPGERPPVDQYDLILIDECHRGYLLDREMSDGRGYVPRPGRLRLEVSPRGGVLRRGEDWPHGNARAAHRRHLRRADLPLQLPRRGGRRMAHRPRPAASDHAPRSAPAGISFEEGEIVESLNPRTGEIDTATLARPPRLLGRALQPQGACRLPSTAPSPRNWRGAST